MSAEERKDGAGDGCQAEHVDLELAAQFVSGDAFEGAADGDAGVVDQCGEAGGIQAIRDRGGCRDDGVFVADIELDGGEIGDGGQIADTASAGEDLPVVGGEALGAGKSDSA